MAVTERTRRCAQLNSYFEADLPYSLASEVWEEVHCQDRGARLWYFERN